MSQNNSTAETLLAKAQTLAMNTLDARQSLSERSQYARLSPSVLMDRGVSSMDRTVQSNILQSALDIYIGHYLLSVMAVTKIGNVSVERILDPFATRRMTQYGVESFTYIDKVTQGHLDFFLPYHQLQDPQKGLVMFDRPVYTVEASPTPSDFGKQASVAVGKIVNVPLYAPDGKLAIEVPVVATLSPRAMPTEFITELFSAFIGKDRSVLGRWHQFWAGDIDAADYFLSLDISRDERRFALKDQDGIYKGMKEAAARNFAAEAVTGDKSANTASAILVVTEATAQRFEAAMRGNLSNTKVRSQMFAALNSTMLIVVNPESELIRLYQRGIPTYGIHSFEDLSKSGSAGSGSNNINDIIKAVKASESFKF